MRWTSCTLFGAKYAQIGGKGGVYVVSMWCLCRVYVMPELMAANCKQVRKAAEHRWLRGSVAIE